MKKISALYIVLTCLACSAVGQIARPLNSGLRFIPRVMTTHGKVVYVAYRIKGDNVNGNTFGISAWDGNRWLTYPTFVCDTGSYISALKVYKDELYIAGKFTRLTGADKPRNIVKFKDRKYHSLPQLSTGATKINSYINTLSEYNGKLVVGGNFNNTAVAGGIHLAFFDGDKWVSSNIKELENVNGPVLTAVEYDKRLYIGGLFSKVGLTKSQFLAQFQNGEIVSSGLNAVRPSKMVTTDKGVFILGSSTGGVRPNQFFKMVGSVPKSILGENMEAVSVSDFTSDGTVLYASGEFRFKGSTESYNLVKYENERWSAMGSGSLPSITRILPYGDYLILAGLFKNYDDLRLNYIAKIAKAPKQGLLIGRVYFNKNQDCEYQNGDEPLNDRAVIINPGNVMVRPNTEGLFMAFLEPGTYEVSVANRRYWGAYPGCGSLAEKVEVKAGQRTDMINFALKMQSGIKDLGVKLTSTTGPRVKANNKQLYQIDYTNYGSNEVIRGTVSLKFDKRLSNLQAKPAPTQTFGDSVVWDINSVYPGRSGTIQCLFDLSGSTTEDLALTANIAHQKSEDDKSNNQSSLTQEIVEEDIDIHKYVNPGVTFNDTCYINTTDDAIEYQVTFANYTTDTVRSVYVIDTIPLNGNITSIDDIAFSHSMVDASYPGPPFSDYYVLVYKFEDINLPPNPNRIGETVDDKGFALFQLRLNGDMNDGQSFSNTATVEFDYTFEKRTNTVIAMVDDELSSVASRPKVVDMDVYPNPTDGWITISNETVAPLAEVELISPTGQSVQHLHVGMDNRVDLRHLSQGIYYLRIPGGAATYVAKIVKLN